MPSATMPFLVASVASVWAMLKRIVSSSATALPFTVTSPPVKTPSSTVATIRSAVATVMVVPSASSCVKSAPALTVWFSSTSKLMIKPSFKSRIPAVNLESSVLSLPGAATPVKVRLPEASTATVLPAKSTTPLIVASAPWPMVRFAPDPFKAV